MKPKYIEVVFQTKNPQAVAKYKPYNTLDDLWAIVPVDDPDSPFTVAEKSVFSLALDGIVKSGIPVTLLWADYYKATENGGNTQITYLERNGITNYPSLQILAEYPDGSERYYRIYAQTTDMLTYSANDIALMIKALANAKKADGGGNSLLCNIFPPLCSIDNWLWLALAGYAAWQAYETEKPTVKVVALAGAGLAANEFFSRGGFDALKTPTVNNPLPSTTLVNKTKRIL